MTEHPIIFNGAMVRAILDGRKTQTRRVIKPHPKVHHIHTCPYGQTGDRLWVRETWLATDCAAAPFIGPPRDIVGTNAHIYYRASLGMQHIKQHPDYRPETEYKWRPSIFMPRWASRLTLEVVSVRVERVQDIKLGDIIAEGWSDAPKSDEPINAFAAIDLSLKGFEWFPEAWDSINAKRGFGWEVNPWIWVVEFRMIDGN